MSLMRAVLNRTLRWSERRYLEKETDPIRARLSFERKARFFFRVPRGVASRQERLGNRPALMVGDGSVTILYLHGGGYFMGSPATHKSMAAVLSRIATVRVAVLDYRLAPENPYPAAVEDALAAYQDLLGQGVLPDRIVLAGDSAGGGLMFALLSEVCRLGLPQPLCSFAFSPLVDLTDQKGSRIENAERDVMLPVDRMPDMVAFYLGDTPRDLPTASPIYADFRGANPVAVFVGDTEILLDDATRITQKLRADGVAASLTIEHDCPHVWPMFAKFLPEGRATLAQVGQFIQTCRDQLATESR